MLRRSRSHHYGYTNIDYRSKEDVNSMLIHQPWKQPKDFGTMGHAGYTLPYDKHKNILKISQQLNTLQHINSECPDPKTYNTCKFYNDNKIPIKAKTHITKPTERVAQLDENLKGKDIFIGDSMMIADLTHARERMRQEKKEAMLKRKAHLTSKKVSPTTNKALDVCGKDIKEKEVKHEDDHISKRDAMLEGDVDINKLKRIRMMLRDKYSNKHNYRKIFKEWTSPGEDEIKLENCYRVINNFGIPINHNETRALIASSNLRGSDNTLNMEEFMNLIFYDNNILDMNLHDFQYKDNNISKIDQLTKHISTETEKANKNSKIDLLEDYLRLKIPKLVQLVQHHNANETNVDYNTYLSIMNKIALPQQYNNENVLKGLFDRHLNNEQQGMNIKTFAEKIITKSLQDKNNFFLVKNNILNHLERKLHTSRSEVYEGMNLLQKHKEEQKHTLNEYLSQIEMKRQRRSKLQKSESTPDMEVNSMQPSTAFLVKMYGDRKEINRYYDEIEKSYTALPSLLGEMKAKTRSGANPVHKNTFLEFQPPQNSGMFMSEEERFKVRSLDDKIDFVKRDRDYMRMSENSRLQEKRKLNEKIGNYVGFIDKHKEQLEKLALANKVKRLYDYETKHKILNEIIE